MSKQATKRRKIDLAALQHKAAFTVAEFCARNGICRATFDNYVRAGLGPKLTQKAHDIARGRSRLAPVPRSQSATRTGAAHHRANRDGTVTTTEMMIVQTPPLRRDESAAAQ